MACNSRNLLDELALAQSEYDGTEQRIERLEISRQEAIATAIKEESRLRELLGLSENAGSQ